MDIVATSWDFCTTTASGVPLSVPALNSPAQRSGAAKSKEEAEGQKAQLGARGCAGGQVTGLLASGHGGLIRKYVPVRNQGEPKEGQGLFPGGGGGGGFFFFFFFFFYFFFWFFFFYFFFFFCFFFFFFFFFFFLVFFFVLSCFFRRAPSPRPPPPPPARPPPPPPPPFFFFPLFPFPPPRVSGQRPDLPSVHPGCPDRSGRQPRQHRDFAVTLAQDASHVRPQPGELPSGDGRYILLRYTSARSALVPVRFATLQGPPTTRDG